MSERETFISPPTESPSAIRRGIDLVSRYETAITSGVFLSSILWIEKANDVFGINIENNPAFLTELGVAIVGGSVLATAIHSGDKPSQVLKDIGYVITIPLRRKAKSE